MKERNCRRILQITAHPFPPAIRVVKEGTTLRDAGYRSAVLCPPIKGRPARETWRGIEVYRPDTLAGAATIGDKLLYETLFFSPAWYRALREVISEENPDVLHVHDVWLGRTAFAARQGQRVVMDLHENWPAAVVQYLGLFRGAFKWFYGFYKNPLRVKHYERALLAKSDLVFVVVQEALRRVLEAHPELSHAKVVNVENLESKLFAVHDGGTARFIDDDHFSILYIGGFGPHRGLDTLIGAMKYIKDWRLNVRLHLIGATVETVYLKMLRTLIRRLGVESSVRIVGWVPFETVLGYIDQASVGAVPHHSNPHTDNTIPHKLYQYMMVSKPVLVSTSAPLARVVRAGRAGVIFTAGDEQDCAERIRDLFEDQALSRQYGANGYRYVMTDGHNWEDESAKALVAAYDQLLGVGPLRT